MSSEGLCAPLASLSLFSRRQYLSRLSDEPVYRDSLPKLGDTSLPGILTPLLCQERLNLVLSLEERDPPATDPGHTLENRIATLHSDWTCDISWSECQNPGLILGTHHAPMEAVDVRAVPVRISDMSLREVFERFTVANPCRELFTQ